MEEKNPKQIDFTKIAKTLWPHRKKYFVVLPATLIITYLITLCVPRTYKCTVSLAPESMTPNMSGSLGSLASSFGLGASLGKMATSDAIFAEIYPDVIESKNFIAGLMSVEVTTKKGDLTTKYYTYLRDHQKAAWWSEAISMLTGLFKSSEPDTYSGEEKLSVLHLTKRQDEIFEAVKGKIKCSVDKKTDVVSITVTDQDPLVCATMADSTCRKLQEFITAYRTHKASVDYEYYQKMCEETKKEYEKARQQYASFSDANLNMMLARYKAKEDELENEMQLRYNVYTAMTTQMQSAQARLQEATPAFTVIQSASVPYKPAGPKRMFISIGMMMLAFFILSVKLLAKSK